METPMMPLMMPQMPSSRGHIPFPQYYPMPMYPSFFPPGWFGQYGNMPLQPPSPPERLALPAPPVEGEAGPSRALITLPRSTPRDTPASYPTPPVDDPDNPPVPIHPYLYHLDTPVVWDVRTSLMHCARRSTGERLSSVALKANAINAGGLNHTKMKILCSDDAFPWTVTITRDKGISVGDVLTEIASMLDKEVTEAEQFIASIDKRIRAERSRVANEGTGAIKTREKGDPMRRVDWLGTKTKFRALVHSSANEYEPLVRRRIHAHDKPNTWVMILEDREAETPEAIEAAEATVKRIGAP